MLDPWVAKIPWRRAWQPITVLLPGETHGQRSLAGYSSWGRKEWDITELTQNPHTNLLALSTDSLKAASIPNRDKILICKQIPFDFRVRQEKYKMNLMHRIIPKCEEILKQTNKIHEACQKDTGSQ